MSKIGKTLLAFVIVLSSVSIALAQDRGLDVVARSVGGADYKIGRQYAVLIAVDRYKEWTPLRNPVKDARTVREILQRRYFIDEFVELYDEDATAVGIRRLFADLIDRTKPADSVLIYYAGHGYTDRFQTGFWIPADGGKDIEAQERWLPNQQIRNFVTQIKAHSVALVSDSCFSGDLLNVHRGAAPTVDSEYFRNALKYTSRQVLTSGASETVPDESEFARQFKSLLENNTEQAIDPLVMYDRIRRGVTKTLPLLGTLPGQETGGSFLLFLREGGSQASAAPGSAPASFKPQSSNDAELMVSLSGGVKTADIYVNGAKVGTAPSLVQKLPSGVPLVIEARSGYDSGRTELTLKSKELREISLKLERMKGNLFIESNEKDVDAYLDGVRLGALGSGLFRDLSAGEHSLELKGANLYYKGSVTIPGNETGRASARVYGIGSVEVNAPDGVTVSLSGNGLSRRVSGSATIADLPVGSYTLSSSGSGYESASTSLSVGRGTVARWTPYSVGTLVFATEGDATLSVDGREGGAVPASLSLAPGTHKLVFRAAGYHDDLQTVVVAAGRKSVVAANLKEFQRASLVIPQAPFGATIKVHHGDVQVGTEDAKLLAGALEITDIPAGIPVAFAVEVPFADELDQTAIDSSLTLDEAEKRTLELPVGAFTLPWLPDDGTVSFTPNGATFSSVSDIMIPMADMGSFLRSPSLAAGTYTVALTGKYAYTTQVRIEAGKTTELPGYREALGGALKAQRLSTERAIKAKAGRKTAGWVSLGAGILGAGGAAAAYVLGAQARDAYVSAQATSDVTAAREQVALWGSVFVGAASVGGAGLGLAPLLWAIGPDPKALEDSIKALDEGLKRLGE